MSLIQLGRGNCDETDMVQVKVIPLFSGAAFSERYLGFPAKEEHAYLVRIKADAVLIFSVVEFYFIFLIFYPS